MTWLYSLIGTPLGYIMWVCYALVQNFGWAIILFTLIVKAAMFPLNLKQQKNMAISQLYLPRVKEIQTKYKNNPEKQQEELTKLQKEGYNPTGGCGTMILTFIILFGVIDVVYKPMTHMEHFSGEQINAIVETAKEVDVTRLLLADPANAQAVREFLADETTITLVEATDDDGKKTNNRIVLADDFDLDEARAAVTLTDEDVETLGSITSDQVSKLIASGSRLSDPIRSNLNLLFNNYYSDSSLYRELRALKAYENADNRPVFAANEAIPDEISARLDQLSDRMYFGPINLIDQPTWSLSPLVIVPIIAFLFSLAQMYISQLLMKKQNPDQPEQPTSAKMMLYVMPFISLWISFSVPAGVGFYWAISYLFGIAQSLITYKFWPSDKIRAEAKAKMDAKLAKTEQRATIVEVDAEGNKTEKTARLSELTQKELKELNRRKLEAARKADAEKYGEEYVESPDDDF
ncbi:MAG: YidC/Oxa1 family membrane protein insertase [Bacteroides sp.]|nr:YidC/Oxa1 family membrane protein insertase [Eubacterium sp.]MCM1418494.1 YidC/Oxa1 family membrane protein insertase [Roseburia sp.]MCM1462513.1 YidC/Oxa1 family membrane protein insertase [Bacteroides sp.]